MTRLPIRILIVDDHDIVTWGLRQLIDGQRPEMEVAGTASTSADALLAARRLQPDLILLDMDLGGDDALDIMSDLEAASRAYILVLTGVRDQCRTDEAVLRGARGIVMKDGSPEVLLRAVRNVVDGQLWLDRAATSRIFDHKLGRQRQVDVEKARYAALTAKEREVVRKVVEAPGASNREIAALLFMSEHTLRNHLSSIYQKVEVDNRLKLYAHAVKHCVSEA